MEKLLKRYFWVVHVAFIMATAGLVALAVNNLIGGFLSPLAVMAPPPPKKASVFADNKKPTLGRTEEKLWGKDLPVAPEAEQEKPAEEVPVETAEPMGEGEYPVSELAVTLTGTMVADDPSWSMALLIDNGSRSSFMAKVNENILEGDSRLVKIERDRIILEREGQLEQIEINETGNIARSKPGSSRSRKLTGKPLGGSLATPRVSATSPPSSLKKKTSAAAGGAASSLKAGIKKINENQFEVSRKTLNDVMKNPGKFRDGTRPIPNYQGGKVNGFKLVNMKPGSIYYDLGIRPGDVITAVNGKPLDSPNRALELYQKLGSLNNVSLEVQRNGQKRQMSFNIK